MCSDQTGCPTEDHALGRKERHGSLWEETTFCGGNPFAKREEHAGLARAVLMSLATEKAGVWGPIPTLGRHIFQYLQFVAGQSVSSTTIVRLDQ